MFLFRIIFSFRFVRAYLIFVAHATHGVGVKIKKWEEFFPFLTQKEPLWNLVECVLNSLTVGDFTHNEYFFTQCLILNTMCNFTHSV